MDVDGKDAIIKEYNRDKVNRIDAGLMLGAGYTLLKGTGWTIGAKYYYGFVNTYKGIPGTGLFNSKQIVDNCIGCSIVGYFDTVHY